MNRSRYNLQISGIVQGVGFRPFLHRLMKKHGLNGWIRNTGEGAELETECNHSRLEAFLQELKAEVPPLARIDGIQITCLQELKAYREICILPSDTFHRRDTLISPDVAVCPDCLQEMHDPANRRYLYPFINCTNCGPRFSIIRGIPYDRSSTTMSAFAMCPQCAAEYEDIGDRRYHAQPDCCSECGPELFFLDANGQRLVGDPILLAAEQLRGGKIIAVKGLGGIHLACRCDDPALAAELRMRKHRDEKPMALMCRNIEAAKLYCSISADEANILCSYTRPIVLLEKRDADAWMHLSENKYLGIMLAYTPVHHLLLEAAGCDLIMTSANLSDLPIITENAQALKLLQGIADGYLLNNRDIENRCDDSLMWVIDGNPYPVRRSRGYAPLPLRFQGSGGILACGAEQKASFCLSRGSQVFQSAHIGDLKNADTLEHYERQIALYERLFDTKPKKIVCDLHPDYLSSDYAFKRARTDGVKTIAAQHHHAHMAACMADHELEGTCIGIIWDGTGYGTDGSIWGGEFLTGDYRAFTRAGTLRPVKLAGGDRAIKEIWRTGAALMLDAGLEPESLFPGEDIKRIRMMLDADFNCPNSHGMGRLFDGICAITGIRSRAGYEGQGAVLLEAAAEEGCEESYPFEIETENNMYILDVRPMVAAVCSDVLSGTDTGRIAACFMNTLVKAAAEICMRIRTDSSLDRVILSGGVFQNMYLLKRLTAALEAEGFSVFRHSRVSTNDEGISFGQIAIAERGGGIDVSCGTAENY